MKIFSIDISVTFCVLVYLILGGIWYVADESMHRAIHHTPGTTKWSRRMSVVLFVVSWPYWVYIYLRLAYIQYKTMQLIMDRKENKQ
jgi:hypothetical protein